jgi:hypothetical protein
MIQTGGCYGIPRHLAARPRGILRRGKRGVMNLTDLYATLWVIFWGSLAGLAIIACFVLPNRQERKNREW